MSELLDEANEAIDTFDELVRQRDNYRTKVQEMLAILEGIANKTPCNLCVFSAQEDPRRTARKAYDKYKESN